MATNFSDIVNQLTEATAQGVPAQPSESLLSALSNTQNSPYKFSDWAKTQGYDYSYNQASNTHFLNGIELPKETSTALLGDYAPEQTYKDILAKYKELSDAQIEKLDQTTAYTTPPKTQGGTPTAATDTTTADAEAEYKSPYEEQINQLLEELKNITPYQTPEELEQYLLQLLESANQPFTYDPTQDAALKVAQQEAERKVREGAGAKGTLYSSGTISNMAKAAGSLIPEYEMKQYQRFADEKNRQVQMMTTLMQWDELQANRHYDQVKLIQTKFDYIMSLDQMSFDKFQVMLEQKQFQKQYELEYQTLQLQKQMQDIEEQYQRVEALGYVDKKASVILGIPVGTKAQWVKELELQQKQELEKIKKDFENQKKLQKEQGKIDKALIKYKNSLEEATQKKIMAEQYKNDKKLLELGHNLEMGGATGSITAAAKDGLGIKYVYGGNSVTSGMDCSSFTQYVMKQNGISIARTAAEQANGGNYVAKNELQAGDLVFFNTIDGNGKNVDHVGIYMGNGQMIHNSSSQGKVVQVNMNTSYWNERYTTARRYSGSGSSSGPIASSGSVGHNSTDVSTKQLQKYLKGMGYYSGTIDGKYGPGTTAAVKAFQRDHNLDVDGNFGSKSWAVMKKYPLSTFK